MYNVWCLRMMTGKYRIIKNEYNLCYLGYSFTIVDMIVLDTEKPSGKVIIDKEIRTIEMIEQIVSEPSGICKGKGQVVPVENIIFHYEDLTEVVFGVKLPPPPKPVRERKSQKHLVFFSFNEISTLQ